jgi:1-acyl-sn-glycerol-3-phosphate acyltransferase
VIGASFVLGWLAVMVLPRLSWRWAALRTIARAAFKLIGAPLSVTGLEHIPRGGAVLAFNHESYMDALTVAAALPGTPTYVVKKELAGQMFAGPLLRRLDALFLDRFEVVDSLSDLDSAQAAAQRNRLLVFFPEGTFTRRAGLSGFYLGAFKGAGEPAGLTGHPARHTHNAARRAVVSALEPDQRHHRATDHADRH